MQAKSLFFVSILLTAFSAQGGIITPVSDPVALGADDSVNWAQLGGDQSTIPNTFIALSGDENVVTGSFAVTILDPGSGNPSEPLSTGQVAVICPAAAPTCSWTTSGTGMNAGDSTIWTDNPSGSPGPDDPLTLALSDPVYGAGAWLQDDETSPLGEYIATLTAYDSSNAILGIGAYTFNSDANGDPVFLGLLDTQQEISKLVFDVTSVPSNAGTDFVLDTLQLTTPEPGSLALLAFGLAGVGCRLRNVRRS